MGAQPYRPPAASTAGALAIGATDPMFGPLGAGDRRVRGAVFYVHEHVGKHVRPSFAACMLCMLYDAWQALEMLHASKVPATGFVIANEMVCTRR